jgi:hypothetical protein
MSARRRNPEDDDDEEKNIPVTDNNTFLCVSIPIWSDCE